MEVFFKNFTEKSKKIRNDIENSNSIFNYIEENIKTTMTTSLTLLVGGAIAKKISLGITIIGGCGVLFCSGIYIRREFKNWK
jgi:hypothetical protein